MKKSVVAALSLCTTTLVLVMASPASFSSGAVGASGKSLTDAEIGTMAPAKQAALLDPLRAVAGALSDVGRGRGVDVFTSAGIDANHDVVNLYLTDTARAAGFIQAARSASPSIDTNLIRIHKATNTLADMDDALERYLAKRHPYSVYAISAAPDGSGLKIEVDNPAAASKADSPAAAVTTVGRDFVARPAGAAKRYVVSPESVASTVDRLFSKGSARHTKSAAWNNVKWHDSSPFIGGDVITNGSGHCTTGLPAVRKSDGRPVMVTAAHCFGVGQRIYTYAVTTWSWSNSGSP